MATSHRSLSDPAEILPNSAFRWHPTQRQTTFSSRCASALSCTSDATDHRRGTMWWTSGLRPMSSADVPHTTHRYPSRSSAAFRSAFQPLPYASLPPPSQLGWPSPVNVSDIHARRHRSLHSTTSLTNPLGYRSTVSPHVTHSRRTFPPFHRGRSAPSLREASATVRSLHNSGKTCPPFLMGSTRTRHRRSHTPSIPSLHENSGSPRPRTILHLDGTPSGSTSCRTPSKTSHRSLHTYDSESALRGPGSGGRRAHAGYRTCGARRALKAHTTPAGFVLRFEASEDLFAIRYL